MTTIEVTQECIDHGRRYDCDSCPIAVAVARVMNNHPCVTRFWVTTTSGFQIHLPPEASAFVAAFDHDEPVAPISFGLEIPERFLREQVTT